MIFNKSSQRSVTYLKVLIAKPFFAPFKQHDNTSVSEAEFYTSEATRQRFMRGDWERADYRTNYIFEMHLAA